MAPLEIMSICVYTEIHIYIYIYIERELITCYKLPKQDDKSIGASIVIDERLTQPLSM